MKIKAIVNPNACGGKLGQEWGQIALLISQSLGDFEVSFTEKVGDATAITKESLTQGYQRIIAVGGDGTLNEVVNGFFTGRDLIQPKAVLSFLMRGTGGDFRKTLGISKDIVPAINAMSHNPIRTIDLGRMTYIDHNNEKQIRYFDNMATIGMGGEVDKRVNRAKHIKKLGGMATFLWATLQTLVLYQNKTIRLKVDEKFDETLKVRLVAVANGQFGGGGMHIAPQARLDDNLLDIVILGDIGRLRTLLKISKVYQGTHVLDPRVKIMQGKIIVAESDEEVLLDVDGEALGKLPATFEIVPAAIRIQ